MKNSSLLMKRCLRATLFVLLLGAVGLTKSQAYSFSAVCSTGQTLYYNITNATNHYVDIVCPGTAGTGGWNNYTKPGGEVELPESVVYDNTTYIVTRINQYAFYGCTEITVVHIPESITYIGQYAFWNCPNISMLYFDAINCTQMYTKVNSTNYSVFNSSTSASDGPSMPCIILGENVTNIPNYAFPNSKNLYQLIIPEAVTNIGMFAFDGCSNLGYIQSLASTPPTLGTRAFYGIPVSVNIIVPCNATGAYTAAEGWSNYGVYYGYYYEEFPYWVEVNVNYPFLGSANIIQFPDCDNNGQTIVTATANPNCSFLNWTIDGEIVSTNPVYSFVQTRNMDLVANFVGAPVDITATAEPSIGGTVTGGGTYNQGSNCTLTATANTGYRFMNWTENGTPVSTEASYSFTVMEERNLVAHFQQTYSITATANLTDGGTVSGSGEYLYGQSCTVTAAANTGYTFLHWTENGNVVSTNAIYTFNVTEGRSLIAEFQINTYNITATAEPEGCGTVNGSNTYTHGEICTLTATPATGYIFANWTKNGIEVSMDSEYTFPVTESATYVAHFSLPYTINVSVSGDNQGSVSGGGIYPYGQICTITATANEGYTFINWTENNNEVSTGATYRFTVTGDRILVANFLATPTGVTGGLFSVDSTRRVVFSNGNLQYQASTRTWRFAENQWDYVGTQHPYQGNAGGTVSGSDNYNISSTYSGWIDLFSWGTSGFNHGAVCYMPYNYGSNNNDRDKFNAYGSASKNLFDAKSDGSMRGQADWGYNAISNGGNMTNIWRTLTIDEWLYLLNSRIGTRYAKAVVNNVKGLILLPDGWDTCFFSLNSINSFEASYESNIVSMSQWAVIEQHGAVFLPAAGAREGGRNAIVNVGDWALYWTSSNNNDRFASAIGTGTSFTFTYYWAKFYGISVRLVQNFGYSCSISASAIPFESGTVLGSGDYYYGQSCTLTAAPAPGYVFANWTKDGVEVSTNATYSFSVTESALYVANFSLPYTINVSACPTNGGTETGGGIYAYGQSCTLTASPEIGYTFSNWTENGAVVSTSASYTFTVNGNRDLVANYMVTPAGAISGIFSVSANKQVCFSQGNLQYQASTHTWRFAENQWDNVGSDNANITSTYSGWIDLFGWGTSGYNHGAVCYQPWSTNTNAQNYYAYGCNSCSLYDQTGQADWGYNAISNGGNTENLWRTLTHQEWSYLFQGRVTSSGILYAKACVNNVNGVIFLPDSWDPSYYSLNNTNVHGANCSSNIISADQWTTLEQHGAVFLPLAGYRNGTTVGDVNNRGNYVIADYYGQVLYLYNGTNSSFNNQGIYLYNYAKYQGASVRLVREPVCIINAISNPAEGGSVYFGDSNGNLFNNSISCDFTIGDTCTLTASPNGSYIFTNWTENGEVVSTEATYSFEVTCSRSLVANFEELTNHWSSENTGGYSLTMSLTGVIQIDGIEQYSDMLEVGVFCGDECRGAAIAAEFSITHRYLVALTICGQIGNQLTFKLYDHSLGQEYELTSPAAVTFNEEGYGTPIVPYILNFTSTVAITATVDPEGAGTVTGTGEFAIGTTCTLTAIANEGYAFINWTEDGEVVSSDAIYSFTVMGDRVLVANFVLSTITQTDNLIEGWNWWSTCIELNGINGLEMLQNSLGGAGIRIQAKIGSTDYFEYQGTGYWYGSLNAITNEQMYKIRTSAECSAVLVGDEALPANHPITLHKGWSWIGYPSGQSVSLDDAFSNFTPEPDDVIKGRYSSSTFVSYNGYELWYGTLNTLQPGQGYMYKSNSNETKTLVFNTGNGNREVKPNITSEGNRFVPSNGNYSDNMLITTVVDLGGMELRSGDYELAAFVGDECRGSVRLMFVAPFDRYEAFLLVYGNESETLRFVLTDGTEASQSDDHILYESDGIVGTASEPVTLHFGPLGVEDGSLLPVNIYPNPSKGIFNVEGFGLQKVEVMDAQGQVILSQEVENDFLQINLSDKAKGAYLLRVVTTNGITTKKVLMF